jgi:hypothetical protein
MRIKRELKNNNLSGQLVLTVHDSVIYEVPDNEVEASVKIIKTEIERPIEGVNVEMMAEVKVGTRWGELVEVISNPSDVIEGYEKKGFTPETIQDIVRGFTTIKLSAANEDTKYFATFSKEIQLDKVI